MSEVDWGRYNLPAIAGLIADVDVCDGADRVLAWDGLAASVRDQHQRLLSAADKLAEVWPPGANDSALEFQRQVKGLADSMQETLTRAEDTRSGLNGVVQAFSTAQEKVRSLVAGRQAVSDDWMPRFVDHAEDKYDEHAQAAMREAEAAIQDHGAQIQPPPLYKMDTGKSDDGRHIGNGGGGSPTGRGGDGALRATPVPVPPSAGPPTTTLPGLGNSASGNSGNVASGADGGPVLSGVAPVTSAPVPFPNAASSGVGPSAGFGGSGPGAFGVLPVGTGGFGSIDGESGVMGTPGTRRPVPVRRGLPAGAVIGEESERGVGGRAGGAAGGVMPMGGGMAGARGSGRRRRDGSTFGDADQRWRTDEGVDPVIRPDDSQVRHDPGPGVIGLDR